MEEVETLYEKKVNALLDKMFGETPSELKAITKMTLMNNVLTDDMKHTLIKLREKQLEEMRMIQEEMEMTLDASGNVVPIAKEESPRQSDIRVIYHDN